MTLTGAGVVTLRATQPADGKNAAGTVETSIPVAKAAGSLSMAVIPDHTFGDAVFDVQATASSASTGTISYAVFSGPAVLTGSTLRLTGAGTVRVTATQAADANFTASSIQTSFNVAPAASTLALAAIPQHVFGDAPFPLSAVSSSSAPIAYSVASGPAMIAGNVVTLTGAGVVTLRAVQETDGRNSAGTAEAAVVVARAAGKIDMAPIQDHVYGDAAFDLHATSTTASTGAIRYAVSSGPAVLAGSTLQLNGTGRVAVTATQAEDANFTAASTQISFNVAAAASTLAFPGVAQHVFGDAPFPVSASSSSSTAIEYSVLSGPASIAGNVVTLTGAGVVTLRAAQAADGRNAAGIANTTFLVAKAAGKVNLAAIPGHTYGDAAFDVHATSATASTGSLSYAVASGPGILTGSSLRLTGTGTVLVTATQAEDANFTAGFSQAGFAVATAAGGLVFDSIAAHAFGDSPFAVSARPSTASTGAISYAVASGPATITGRLVTPTGAGTVIVTATQDADSNFSAASVQTTFIVARGGNALSFVPVDSHTYGDQPFKVRAISSTASTGKVTYAVLAGPGTVSGDTITLVGAGTLTLSASQAADAKFDAASAQATFPVARAANSLSFVAVGSHTFGDQPFKVRATPGTASTGALTYAIVAGPAIMSGDTVTVTGAGTIALSATQAADNDYAGASAQATFTVAKAANSLTFAPIDSHTYGDQPFKVKANSSTASSGAITYTVLGGPGTVSNDAVTLTGAGTITLYATQAATDNFAAASTQATFTVAKATNSLTFAPIDPHTYGDQSFKVKATSSTASTGPINYAVLSGPATASSDAITLTGAGTITLTATQAATDNFAAASTQATLTVAKAANSLLFTPVDSHTFGDQPFRVKATSSTASTAPVTYALLTGPGSVSGDTVTILGAGTITLSANQATDANFAAASASVTAQIARFTGALTFSSIASHTYGDAPFSIRATSSTASTGAITYSVVSGPATILGDVVTLTGGGKLVLAATQAADPNYRSIATQITSTVLNPGGLLSFDPIPAHTVGDAPFQVRATSPSKGGLTYSIISGPATIASDILTVNGTGEVVVQAAQASDGTYAAATTRSSFAVNKQNPSLAFRTIAPFIYGDAPFTVSATSLSSGAMTYSVSSGPATISGSLVTVTGSGDVTLSVRQASTATYAAATVQTTFTSAVPNTSPAGLIEHVVVIFQENVSFDHYFGTYPTAANGAGDPIFTALPSTPAIDGYTQALLKQNPNATNTRNGAGATNPFRLGRSHAATADQEHWYGAEQMAFHAGAMDLFPLSVGAADGPSNAVSGPALTTGLTMGYFDGNTVTAYWNYAQHFAMSDHFFGTNFGPSTVGALNLISGQTNGAVDDSNAAGLLVADGYGGHTVIADPQPVNDICANAAGSLIHMTGKNIGDLLNASDISWGFFQGGFDTTLTNPNGSTGCRRSHGSLVTNRTVADYLPHHQPFQYYASTANPKHARPLSTSVIGSSKDTRANHQYDTHDFFDALKAGNFPAVSFVKAPAYQDGHAGYSDPLDEQTFVVSTINAIQQTVQWPKTVILIAYDDSDGWYDHAFHVINGSATPADQYTSPGKCADGTTALPGVSANALHAQGRCGYGPRLPLIAISPWSRANYVDSTVTDQTSILRFIEDTFLKQQRLGQGSFDSISGEINGMFDFRRSSPQNQHTVLLNELQGTVTTVN